MSIETRIPRGRRGVELIGFPGLRILGPLEIDVTVENAGADPEARGFGLPKGMTVAVGFRCVPFVVDSFDDPLDDDPAADNLPVGRYFATNAHVTVEGGVVTSTAMSRLSFPKILRTAIDGIAGEFRVATFDAESGDYVARTFREPSELGTAGAWAYGRLLGMDPTLFIQTVFGLNSRQAAAQRVSRARHADPPQLPPTTQGAH